MLFHNSLIVAQTATSTAFTIETFWNQNQIFSLSRPDEADRKLSRAVGSWKVIKIEMSSPDFDKKSLGNISLKTSSFNLSFSHSKCLIIKANIWESNDIGRKTKREMNWELALNEKIMRFFEFPSWKSEIGSNNRKNVHSIRAARVVWAVVEL